MMGKVRRDGTRSAVGTRNAGKAATSGRWRERHAAWRWREWHLAVGHRWKGRRSVRSGKGRRKLTVRSKTLA